mmetsp:Transcript_103631/g.263196  ORF Transcript_103631/g.263196 Transcript_103631/m.263196 type:complete len:200 (-) Transcript_103631:937-1536(-)
MLASAMAWIANITAFLSFRISGEAKSNAVPFTRMASITKDLSFMSCGSAARKTSMLRLAAASRNSRSDLNEGAAKSKALGLETMAANTTSLSWRSTSATCRSNRPSLFTAASAMPRSARKPSGTCSKAPELVRSIRKTKSRSFLKLGVAHFKASLSDFTAPNTTSALLRNLSPAYCRTQGCFAMAEIMKMSSLRTDSRA